MIKGSIYFGHESENDLNDFGIIVFDGNEYVSSTIIENGKLNLKLPDQILETISLKFVRIGLITTIIKNIPVSKDSIIEINMPVYEVFNSIKCWEHGTPKRVIRKYDERMKNICEIIKEEPKMQINNKPITMAYDTLKNNFVVNLNKLDY